MLKIKKDYKSIKNKEVQFFQLIKHQMFFFHLETGDQLVGHQLLKKLLCES